MRRRWPLPQCDHASVIGCDRFDRAVTKRRVQWRGGKMRRRLRGSEKPDSRGTPAPSALTSHGHASQNRAGSLISRARSKFGTPSHSFAQLGPSVRLRFRLGSSRQTPRPCKCRVWDPHGFPYSPWDPLAELHPIGPTGHVRHADRRQLSSRARSTFGSPSHCCPCWVPRFLFILISGPPPDPRPL